MCVSYTYTQRGSSTSSFVYIVDRDDEDGRRVELRDREKRRNKYEKRREKEKKILLRRQREKKSKILSTTSREKGQSGRSNNDHGGQKHEIASCLSSTRLGDTLSMYVHTHTPHTRIKEREHQE